MKPQKPPSLHDRLVEDLNQPEAVKAVLGAVQALKAWPAPQPTQQSTARLIARIDQLAALELQRGARLRMISALPWLLLKSQARIIYREIWIASPFVLLLGWLVAGLSSASGNALPVAITAPVVAAVGIAFIYGRENDLGIEIELSTPVSPRLILLARLTLVFGYNLALGLAASLILASLPAQLPFWALVSAWLAPMAFLCALSFFITVVSGNSGAGITVSLGIWTLLSLARFGVIPAPLPLGWLAGLFTGTEMPAVWALAFCLCALALWLGGSEERWLGARL